MKKMFYTVFAVLAFLMLGGCAGKGEDNRDLEKITVILDYMPNTNHSGIYAADKLGYFEQEGLKVEIIEPGDNTVTTLIAAGKGDFGFSFQEDVTYARTLDEPLPIRAVAAVIAHNTSGFASYRDKNITRPMDFEGKTYAGWGSPSEEAIVRGVMQADGGDPDKLNYVVSDDLSYSVLRDKVDVIWLYWAWEGIASQLAGMPLNYIELRTLDSRLDFYTPVLIAENSFLEENPETAESFLKAARRGYEYCVQNPESAAEILYESTPEYDLEMLKASQEYLASRYIDDSDSWGLMKDEVWDDYTRFMLENQLIPRSIPASECYTNEFLQ